MSGIRVARLSSAIWTGLRFYDSRVQGADTFSEICPSRGCWRTSEYTVQLGRVRAEQGKVTVLGAETHRRAVDDFVVRECIREPQLSTIRERTRATSSSAANCGRPSATGFNKRLKSDWGSGGRWFESSYPDQFHKNLPFTLPCSVLCSCSGSRTAAYCEQPPA